MYVLWCGRRRRRRQANKLILGCICVRFNYGFAGRDDGHDPARCQVDPTTMLGDEVMLSVLSWMSPADLAPVRLVSRSFCRLASDHALYRAVEIRIDPSGFLGGSCPSVFAEAGRLAGRS